MSSSNSDSEPFCGFTIEHFRNKEEANRAAVFTSEILQENSLKENVECSSSSSSDSQEVEKIDINANTFNLEVPENQSKNGKPISSSSEIEGFLADNMFECTYLSSNDIDETDAECSDVVVEEAYLNRWSSGRESEEDEQEKVTELCMAEPPKKRGKKRSTIKVPKELLGSECCVENCLSSKLSVHQIEQSRLNFVSRYATYEQQRQFMIDWFNSHEYTPGEFAFDIAGVRVCHKAWTAVLGLTLRTFFRIKREFKRGLRVADHSATGSSKRCVKNEYVNMFLESYVKENAENIPNSAFVHLSSSNTWRDIYDEMVETMTSQGQEPCSENHFRQIRKREFSHVKIPKENRMGKCDYCTKIKDEMRTTRDVKIREQILEKRKEHQYLMRAERKCYHARAASGHKYPHQYFSVAIDGMDQNKTELPHSKLCYKGLEASTKLRVHIVGSMIHGRPPIIFMDWRQYKHDSNLTMNVLLQILWIHREFLPDTIYVQLDNTSKENKNQFVFSFFAYLVEINICERLEVCFLKPGHTHIDCDQLFSRLSVSISKLGCLTFKDLLLLIRTCYKQTGGERGEKGAVPQWATLHHLYAIKEWLKPHMRGLHNLRCFYHFAFFRENGTVMMHYKQWNSEAWDSSKYPPQQILDGVPTGIPCILKPDYTTVDLKRLEGMVGKASQIGAFKLDEVQQWTEFIANEKEKAALYETAEPIELELLGTNVDQIYVQSEGTTWPVDDLVKRERPSQPTGSLNSILETFASKERGDGLIEVYTGAYKRTKEIQRDVIEGATIEDLGVGDLVAVHCSHYDDLPQIARVLSVSTDTIDIEWYGGSWTTVWKPAKKRNGKQLIPWTEIVQKSTVKLFDFALTDAGRLRKATIRRLKEAYNLEQSEEDLTAN